MDKRNISRRNVWVFLQNLFHLFWCVWRLHWNKIPKCIHGDNDFSFFPCQLRRHSHEFRTLFFEPVFPWCQSKSLSCVLWLLRLMLVPLGAITPSTFVGTFMSLRVLFPLAKPTHCLCSLTQIPFQKDSNMKYNACNVHAVAATRGEMVKELYLLLR